MCGIALVVVLFFSSLVTAMAGPNLAGKVLDRAALQNVKTYCVDTSNLSPGPVWWRNLLHQESLDVRAVIESESKPKGLISKLPWKLQASCSAPGVDAVLHFDSLLLVGTPLNKQSGFGWRAHLRASDKASSRVIYRAEGEAIGVVNYSRDENDHVDRQQAVYKALWALVSDVKAISKKP